MARRDLIDAGYPVETQRIWPPAATTDPTEPTPTEWLYIASECERLQDEMLAWSRTGHDSNPLLIYNGTLESLIKVYQVDKDSPYHGLRYRTRLRYESNLRILTKAVGKARLAQLSFRDFKRWHEGFRGDEKDKAGNTIIVGHGVERAHGLMVMLRILLGFGALAGLADCERLREVLSKMTFQTGNARRQYMTAAHAVAFRRKAHEMGRPSMALAQAFMFELGLRQKDVIGEWVPVSEPGISAITHHGRKWMTGIDWREIDFNMILRHRLSKSVRGKLGLINPEAGKVEEFDLREYPMVMEELAEWGKISPIPGCGPLTLQRLPTSGPIVLQEDITRPWRQEWFTKEWRRVARAAGLPDDVQNRDSRAGAATEADRSTSDHGLVQNFVAHSDGVTTDRYIRDRREKRSKLQQERVKHRETK